MGIMKLLSKLCDHLELSDWIVFTAACLVIFFSDMIVTGAF